ncbi:Pentatricopeptide repeat-containing protein [Quillaja saponaria]|uniref:Pentatricopeptide repeat-containing protein n=1 Tax=Quillaja saponaria TaxID=32244 RepID=A0AAD7PIF6_QUISA|nr:Pentatricopeptide repeat-containing protein [Quillaja saponaria]
MPIPKPTHLLKHFPSWNCYFKSSGSDTSNYFNRHFLFLSNRISTLQSLLQFHALLITTANSNNIFIASKLISLYSSLNKPTCATKVFGSVYPKDVFLWNSIVKSHFSNGNYHQALDFYSQMRVSGALPNQFTIPMVAAACAELTLLNDGKNIHGLALKLGLFTGNSAVGSSFVYVYSRCGLMHDASLMFDEIIVRDVVVWTTLLIGYVQNDESEKGLRCLRHMHKIGEDDERPNFRTLEGGFQACGNLGALLEGRCLHGFVVKNGIGCSQVVQSSLLSMYSKCGTPQEAYESFSEVINKDILSWTSIIGIYARLRFIRESLYLFWEMQVNGIYPDGIVISCLLSSFSNSMNIHEGKAFHGLIIRRDYALDAIVHNALLSMYCKFGILRFAEKLFNLHERSTESWNSMVSGYSKTGENAKCIELFRQMQHFGIQSDSNSLVSVICSCTQLEAANLGRSMHCNVIKGLMADNVSIANSLIDLYGKCGKMPIAWRIFCRIQRDIISWNTLISSHVHVGHYDKAIDLFDLMIAEDLEPNTSTVVILLSACSHLASLEKGEWVHQYLLERGFKLNLLLGTALVDMYAKCGQLGKARKLFKSMEEEDVISWNVMISGYGMHGDAASAIEIFQQMEKSNVKPNGITFLVLLSACAHAGLVEEGKYLFGRMQDYSVKRNLRHYACMVDILGRSGKLQEAEALVLSMPISPDGGVWGALLSACKIHGEIEMGIRIAKYAIKSDPENDGYYVMISNMYDSIGKWEEAEDVRRTMKQICLMGKTAGWSAI